MRLFIIGCGSIGTRHARNASEKGHELVLYDVDANRAKQLAAELAAERAASIEDGLALKPDAAFICTPPNLHVAQALQCVRARVPVFIEKPLAHALDGVDELVRAAEELKVTTMVACNLRFTAGLQKVRELLPQLGKLSWARIECGSDLRTWRPGTDYRAGYAASREQGGGIVLDAIHELDYAFWLFGQPIKAFSKVLRSGQLEIQTEDIADFSLELERCASVSIHLDYLQPEYTRGCTILGERGSIKWTFQTGTVKAVIGGKEAVHETASDTNAMYKAELDHFLAALSSGQKPVNPVHEAAQTLRHALQLRKAGEEA